LQWELIESLDHESIFARFLAEKGEGVHHIAVRAPNFDETVAMHAKRGKERALSCTFSGIKIAGTDQRLGVSFDQQDGRAVGGWTEYGVIGAYAHTARHAVKCAEWCRTQDVAWRSSPRTGRAGFRLR
jgi:Glyoxalase/Bleomycin resistance protein/Dioxygenase superfamily